MLASYVESNAYAVVNGSYDSLNRYAVDRPIMGRLGAIPVAVIDVGVTLLNAPFAVIENFALAAINLLGCLFTNEYSIKHALFCMEHTVAIIVYASFRLITSPIYLIHQVVAGVIQPERICGMYTCANTYRD